MALSSGRRAIRVVSPEEVTGAVVKKGGVWQVGSGWLRHSGRGSGRERGGGEDLPHVEVAGSGVWTLLSCGNLSLCFSKMRIIITAISSHIVRKTYDNVHQVLSVSSEHRQEVARERWGWRASGTWPGSCLQGRGTEPRQGIPGPGGVPGQRTELVGHLSAMGAAHLPITAH